MAQLVCCPCGTPLDCERLDIIVTLECPRCSRELRIELADPQRGRCHAILTVMEGPHWVGEQFVMPMGQDLIIGKAGGNWISLDSDLVADRHCRLKLTPRGSVQVEDLGSDSGTWIGPLRIARGRLKATESVRLGEFRLRLDFKAAIGGELVSQASAMPDTSGYLPDLRAVDKERTFLDNFAAKRFVIARNFIMSFSWLTAIHHFATLKVERGYEGYLALLVAVVILVPALFAGRRVALVHRYFKYAAILVLAVLGLVDAVKWQMGRESAATFILAAAIPLLTTLHPHKSRTIYGALLGLFSVVFILVLTIGSVLQFIPR